MSSTKPLEHLADAFLQPNDGMGISFWIISIAMIASTWVFLAEAQTVSSHWKTSLHTGGLVTLVAGVHGMYMREYWVQVKASPIVYRYIDWSITVPLQMIEFNLILKAAQKPISAMGFWKLLIGTIVMLAFGYLGETGTLNKFVGFIVGLAGWGFILFEIFAGESGGIAGDCTPAVKENYNTMRIIVSAGWCIYPLGYFLGVCMPVADEKTLNVVYNIADFVNKIGFVLAVWSAAKSESESSKETLLA